MAGRANCRLRQLRQRQAVHLRCRAAAGCRTCPRPSWLLWLELLMLLQQQQLKRSTLPAPGGGGGVPAPQPRVQLYSAPHSTCPPHVHWGLTVKARTAIAVQPTLHNPLPLLPLEAGIGATQTPYRPCPEPHGSSGGCGSCGWGGHVGLNKCGVRVGISCANMQVVLCTTLCLPAPPAVRRSQTLPAPLCHLTLGLI